MKYLTISILLFFSLSLKAEEHVYEQVERMPEQSYERAYIHTDKDCYLAGEEVLFKMYVVNGNFQPSMLSKVGYVEILDTEKPHMQLKIALEKGHGNGVVKIPAELPTGIYRLSGYTRYMRNEGESVFFKKQIAVVNVGQPYRDPGRFRSVEKYEHLLPAGDKEENEQKASVIQVTADNVQYGNRQKVNLKLDKIPGNMANLVVSVYRNDSIVVLPGTDKLSWKKQVTTTVPFSGQWLPEYEGHIVSGRFVPEPQEKPWANLSFVGNNIYYVNGQTDDKNNTIRFYTAGVFGKHQIVTSAVSSLYGKLPYRVDLLTPFDGSLPRELPVLSLFANKKPLLERYTAVQVRNKIKSDSANRSKTVVPAFFQQPMLSYDLDEYTRFGTIDETLIEFVKGIQITKMGGKRIFKTTTSTVGLKALVLLDGIPVYDHEDMLKYNPMYIKKIQIYDGYYTFGNEDFEYIVSFVTHENNLPFFQLRSESQLFDYDFPELPSSFEMPDYSIEQIKNSKIPDLRHTLYWNPSVEWVENKPVNLSFFTSDLRGEFKILVEGITTDGEIIRGIGEFMVR